MYAALLQYQLLIDHYPVNSGLVEITDGHQFQARLVRNFIGLFKFINNCPQFSLIVVHNHFKTDG